MQVWLRKNPRKSQELIKLLAAEGKAVLIATVHVKGEPAEDAMVAFNVERTFGRMFLGREVTLDDGTAVVPFPEGLPGDAGGMLRVVA